MLMLKKVLLATAVVAAIPLGALAGPSEYTLARTIPIAGSTGN